MDRRIRHCAVLTTAAFVGTVSLVNLYAQSPSPASSSSTAVTATPWVQASPPPAASPAKPAAVSPVKAPSSTPKPSATPTREEIARAMARKREEELARDRPMPAKLQPPRDSPQLAPEEREAYERNLNVWLTMPPEEKQTIRGLAADRTREEIAAAYEGSGLNLNDDQKEVFALRYRQERRRLEREIQQKAKAERARRLPEIMERLKREFPAASPVVSTPAKPTPKPVLTLPAPPPPVTRTN